ncbi:DNA-binding transcriptional regulator, ArsR family [Sulfobacillus thermosulfidooxidans DSM 9293]|uniref:DNA-binding transcriptional regulator, ArsR family n=2 Tax=Sulfobacillus thermosulfidooxidans TaxID=28034 RepID=A0A1W1WGG8_SULTA|nr:DNA-binding transcriptional regulator, ArsR family [Sulfobacillus thermosulfidooxidans DSM 9293]
MAEKTTETYALWADFWQALSHPIRLRVLETLRQHGELNVGQLVDRVGIGQGHLSNHLACLKNCGLVTTEAQGRYVYYRMADDRVPALLDLGEAIFSDHWAGVATCAVVSRPAVPNRE